MQSASIIISIITKTWKIPDYKAGFIIGLKNCQKSEVSKGLFVEQESGKQSKRKCRNRRFFFFLPARGPVVLEMPHS